MNASATFTTAAALGRIPRAAFVPAPRLGLGPYTTEPVGAGVAVQLRDASGAGCGLFVTKQLAERTRAHLER